MSKVCISLVILTYMYYDARFREGNVRLVLTTDMTY
jgi:hypothetical protein